MTQYSPVSETRLKQIILRFGQNAELQPQPYQPDDDSPWLIDTHPPETEQVTALMNRQSARSTAQGEAARQIGQALIVRSAVHDTAAQGGHLMLEGRLWRVTSQLKLSETSDEHVFQLGLELVTEHPHAQ